MAEDLGAMLRWAEYCFFMRSILREAYFDTEEVLRQKICLQG